MRLAEQRLILRWWQDYAGNQEPNNTLLREFYVDVIRPSDLYYYGVVFEVFDLLINDVVQVQSDVDAPAAQTPAPAVPSPAKSARPSPLLLPAPSVAA